MSRPIRLADDVINRVLSMVKNDLQKHNIFDSRLNINYSLPQYEDARARLVFEPDAFVKMISLVNGFETEVAWHGTVTRDDENEFTIHDIFVYPQEVAGSTVNTDQEEYETWLYELDDDEFNDLKMQGHSHVNMGTSPSSVDLSHQERIVEQLEDDMFYIFLIWNKKMDYTIKIFDMRENILYETNDVDVFIGNKLLEDDAFMKEAKRMVKEKKYTYTATSTSKDKKATGFLGEWFE